MANEPMRVAIVGCGNIAGPYAKAILACPQLALAGAADLLPERAEALCAAHGGRAYRDLDEVLADPAVDTIVNLTIHHAHVEVITRCLDAGKHVYSEKPLATAPADARALVALARRRKRRLACAPILFLGEAQQTAWKLIREGRTGPVRVVYAETNHGRIESWHPNPAPFYAVGPLFDVGVYPLTLATALFGPVRRVVGAGGTLRPDRVTREGAPFRVEAPDFVTAAVEFAGGVLLRLTTNFYVSQRSRQGALFEIHGDAGSVCLNHLFSFNSDVEFAPFGEPYAAVPPVRPAYPGVDWARGLADLADALREGRPPRVTGEQAAHVVEVMSAIAASLRRGRAVAVRSTFRPPEPMDWAR